jgi:chitin synthase
LSSASGATPSHYRYTYTRKQAHNLYHRHITLCFIQYLLLSPTYINVLSVYAYSNLHDLSWGTKGADNAAADLGSVQGVGKHVQVELVSSQTDIDTAYQDALDNIRLKRNFVEPKKESGEQLQKDVYANFRTNVS